jgi:hypothetical protein
MLPTTHLPHQNLYKMKKLLLVIALGLGITFTQAQAGTTKQAATTTKKEVKATPAKTASTQHAHVKSDGTPDKRFKENKVVSKHIHKKADGSPDMRYKENKPAAKK